MTQSTRMGAEDDVDIIRALTYATAAIVLVSSYLAIGVWAILQVAHSAPGTSTIPLLVLFVSSISVLFLALVLSALYNRNQGREGNQHD